MWLDQGESDGDVSTVLRCTAVLQYVPIPYRMDGWMAPSVCFQPSAAVLARFVLLSSAGPALPCVFPPIIVFYHTHLSQNLAATVIPAHVLLPRSSQSHPLVQAPTLVAHVVCLQLSA